MILEQHANNVGISKEMMTGLHPLSMQYAAMYAL